MNKVVIRKPDNTLALCARGRTSGEQRKQRGRIRHETDSLGEVDVPADKLWGAQTQRYLQHFSIGKDLIPREMIAAYAILKKAAAHANHAGKRLDEQRYQLIVQVCDEILGGEHHDMFPLHVWITGSGTQFNMNVNEVISNRCCQIAGTPLGSKTRSTRMITSIALALSALFGVWILYLRPARRARLHGMRRSVCFSSGFFYFRSVPS